MVLDSKNEGNKLIIKFNDPETKNSISANDWIELRKEIQAFDKSDLKYLILSHSNGNFSSGAQLGENINALMDDVSAAAQSLWDCRKPVVAVVDGICAGAGSNMILLSDFIIATPNTRFIEVFARRGLVVDFAGSWMLPRIIGIQKAKELMMTTDEIDGTTMEELNMLYKLVESDQLNNEMEMLVDKLDKLSFISICMNKEQIKNGLNKTFSESLDLEGVNQKSRFLHSDAAEGMAAFIDKRQPDYKNTLDA
jgi:enoyl-CoA hydratase/carnithine racemase